MVSFGLPAKIGVAFVKSVTAALLVAGVAYGQDQGDMHRPPKGGFDRAVGGAGAGLERLLHAALQKHGFVVQSAPVQRESGVMGLSGSPPPQFPAAETMRVAGVIVRFRDSRAQTLAGANQPPQQELMSAIHAVVPVRLRYSGAIAGRMHVFRFDEAIDFPTAEGLVRRLSRSPLVEHVEPDIIESSQAVSTDPDYLLYQWNMKGAVDGFDGGIDAASAWRHTTGSSRITVAVVDTGVLPHPEFADRLLPGYDFVSDIVSANDGDGPDADASDPGTYRFAGECDPASLPQNSTWHGTHVAGVIGANGANGVGVAGVTWQSRILPVRVLGKCGGRTSDIVNGIAWAAGLPVPGAPANPFPAQIINLSLGGFRPSGCDRAYQEAINGAIGQGALVVVAAGNGQQDAAYYTPANCEGVLTVAAVDHQGEYASYSNLSFTKVHLAAPGGDIGYFGDERYGIYSTVNSGTRSPDFPSWAFLQGTSMAAPHVSGIAALSLAVNPRLSGAELNFLLRLGSNSFPEGTYCALSGRCGAGIANAPGSLRAASILSGYTLVYEFYNSDLNHYFRTGGKTEAALVNTGAAGAGWYDTQDYFYAWNGPGDGALPVCRFYGTPGIGPNSHFYTASARECELVKRDPGWTYEGIAFYAKLPSAGSCRPGERVVYRAYNNRWMYNDSNHRYTTDLAQYFRLIEQGWIGEGAALCSAF